MNDSLLKWYVENSKMAVCFVYASKWILIFKTFFQYCGVFSGYKMGTLAAMS